MSKKTIYYATGSSIVGIIFLAFITFHMMGAENMAALVSQGTQGKAFIYNLLFWLFVFVFGYFSVFLFMRDKLYLKVVPIITLFWNFLFFSQERHLLPEDVTGSFTDLFGFTGDFRNLFMFYAWFFDYSAWLVVILGLTCLWYGIAKKLGKLDNAVMPLVLTALSFVYHRPCSGWICFMSGNGFPLPYYDDEINWSIFLADLAVWALVIYPLIKLLFKKGLTHQIADKRMSLMENAFKALKPDGTKNWKKLILIVAVFFSVEMIFGAIRLIAFQDFESFRLIGVTNPFIVWIVFVVEFVLSIMGIIRALSFYRLKGGFPALTAMLIMGVFFLIMLHDVAIYLTFTISFLFLR